MSCFPKACAAGLAVFLWAFVVTVAEAEPQSVMRSIRDGVYTVPQASRGEPTFQNLCSVCHPDPFWRTAWVGQNVGELYSFISKSMPDDNPGSLSTREVADVLAYILKANGFPAGAVELPESQEVLSEIRIEEPAQP